MPEEGARELYPAGRDASGSMAEERVRFLIRSTEDPLALDGPNVIHGLSRSPKRISSMYVYDKRGTELFERQCETPEYYLRRVESHLLKCYAADILERCGFPPVIELGAGTAEKTRILLQEYARRELRCDYFPIDIDTETLSESCARLSSDFPLLFIRGLGASYYQGLRALPRCSTSRLFMFLGSSLGNMEWQEIVELLAELFNCGASGDYLLLGADLDKDPAIIDRAYNDAAGYGRRSTLNVLDHLNHRYGGDFFTERFRYRSKYNPCMKRNEVRIESLVEQTVTLADLNFTVSLLDSELIDAETMWKFDPNLLGNLLHRSGFSMVSQWIEPEYQYGLFLARHK